jgi:hypothetical protein
MASLSRTWSERSPQAGLQERKKDAGEKWADGWGGKLNNEGEADDGRHLRIVCLCRHVPESVFSTSRGIRD